MRFSPALVWCWCVLLLSLHTVQQCRSETEVFEGIISLQLKYIGEHATHHASEVLVYGQAEPNTFQPLNPGDSFTIRGTYGQGRVLGPIKVTIRYIDSSQNPRVVIIGMQQVIRGAVFGDFKVLDVVRPPIKRQHIELSNTAAEPFAHHKKPLLLPLVEAVEEAEYYGEICDAVKLVIAVDASGSITLPGQGGAPENEAHIRALLKDRVFDLLPTLGANVEATIVYYGSEAYSTGAFTSSESVLKERVDQIEFFQSEPGWFTNWQAALIAADELAAAVPAEEGPFSLVVLFLTDGNPTVHVGSDYVPAHFVDDLVAAVHVADHLKEKYRARIIPIGVGTHVDASNLVAISGPQPQQDFFLVEQGSAWQGSAIEQALHMALSNHVCCEALRDMCGICGGSGSTCIGCDNLFGSGLEYDQCGVCGGDGSQCTEGIIAPCTSEVNVTVASRGWVQLSYNSGEQKLEFVYTDSHDVSEVVLDFVPFGHQPHKQESSACGASLWEYNDAHNEARALFSLETLLDGAECLAYPAFKLEDQSGGGGYQKNQVLRGTLYATRVHSGSQVVSVVQYHFEVRVRNGNVLYADIRVFPLVINVEWAGNVDLVNGDIAVRIVTRVDTLGRGEHLHLGDPSVIRERETGLVPFHFKPNSDFVPCAFVHDRDNMLTCEQHWELRTYGAVGVKDFSGHKPLHFVVFSGDEAVSEAILNLDLVIVRHSDPRIDNQLQPWTHAIQERSIMPSENDVLTMSVGLNNTGFRMVLDKVFYCASEQRDLIPYDVSRPDITGCNTANAGDVAKVLVYDAEKHATAEGFNFTLVSSDSTKTVFRMIAHEMGPFLHHLQYHWHAEPVEGGEAQQQTADVSAEALVALRKWVHHELVEQKMNYASHLFSYARRAYHEPISKRMARAHKHLYWDAARIHTDNTRALAERLGEASVRELMYAGEEDDEDGAYYHHGGNDGACRMGQDHHDQCFYHDYGYYDNDPAYGVGQYNGIDVSYRCPHGQVWYGSHCSSSLYPYYGNTYWIIGFLLLVGVFGVLYYSLFGNCNGVYSGTGAAQHPHYDSRHHPPHCQCQGCVFAYRQQQQQQQQQQQSTISSYTDVRHRQTTSRDIRAVSVSGVPAQYGSVSV